MLTFGTLWHPLVCSSFWHGPFWSYPLSIVAYSFLLQWNLSIVNSHGTQKNVHYTEVFTQEGWDMFMYTCACNTLKTVPSLLVRSSLGGRAIFQTVFLSFYILWFFWIFYESTCISYRLIVYHSSSIHSRRLDVHTMTAICKLNGIWPFHWSTTVMIGRQTKHLSTWYSVKFMGMWDP